MAKSITDILSQIRGGAAINEAGGMLAELVRAVKDTGKGGKLTFTIDVQPDKTDETVVTLQPDVTMKMPKRPKAKGIFYMDDHGGLHREDPRQIELDLEKRKQLEESGAIAMSRVGRGNGTEG